MKKIIISSLILGTIFITSLVYALPTVPSYTRELNPDTDNKYYVGTSTKRYKGLNTYNINAIGTSTLATTSASIYQLTGTTGLEQQNPQSFWPFKMLDSISPNTGMYVDAGTGSVSLMLNNVASWWSNLVSGDMYASGKISSSNLEVSGNSTTTSQTITGITNSFLGTNSLGQVISKATTTWADITASSTLGKWWQSGTNIFNGNSGNVGIGTTTPRTTLS